MPSCVGGSSARYVGRLSLRDANHSPIFLSASGHFPVARNFRSTAASIALFKKNASTVGAGPLIVIDTEVDGAHRSNPLYKRLASSRQQTETPALPTLP